MIVRRLVVVVVALLLAAQIVRNAAAEALSPLHPQSAARFWAGHPSVEIALAMAEIGRASRERRAIDPRTFAIMRDAAAKSPLAPEPFLVLGVDAQTAGQHRTAQRAFSQAQWRDPRSMPAAYFLAQYYFRSGDPLRGLEQTALLARLSPGGIDAVAPYVAAYAREPSSWPQIRALFRSQEGLESGVLNALAADPRNVDAVLALADSDHRRPDSKWLPILLGGLVGKGDYARARALWSSIGGGGGAGELLFDSSFSKPGPPPPFNWSLASGDVGLAERQPGGHLHVIFYGNVDGVLASQLLLLPQGNYRLQMQLNGAPQHPESVRWSIRCANSAEPFALVGVDEAASHGWAFQVPAACPAQWLELSGRSGDIAQQADVTIVNLSLERAEPDA